MKKFFGYLLLILVAAFALVSTVLWMNRISLVTSTLSRELGVGVTLEDLRISTHDIVLEGLHIANPAGSSLPTAFSAEEIKIEFQLTKLFGNNMVIDLVELDDVLFGIEIYETKKGDTNWNRILSNMPKSETKETGSQDSKEPKKTITIELLTVNNLQMQLFNHNLNNRPVDLEPIAHHEFKNISSDGSGNEQFAQFLFKQIFDQLSPLSGVKDLLQNAVKSPFDFLKNL